MPSPPFQNATSRYMAYLHPDVQNNGVLMYLFTSAWIRVKTLYFMLLDV